MKLYATIEAQKCEDGKFKTVRKSQGSNHQINIFINIDDQQTPRFKLFINDRGDGTTDMTIIDTEKPYPNTIYQYIGSKKGKKQ